MTTSKIGVLLVNLGTPHSSAPKDVFHYLNEFLTDGRVIDVPWPLRQLLVRGLIVPRRYRQSAATYRKVWTEKGSPLLVYGKSVQQQLQAALGDEYVIELAMRYQTPSIPDALERLQQMELTQLIVFPLFPQYASATTGSVHQKVMESIRNWTVIPPLSFVNNYATESAFLDAFAEIGRRHHPENYDKVLFSFHGLPERHLQKADKHNMCLKSPDCCQTLTAKNQYCYRAQCFATARGLADRLAIPTEQYRITFQSRLGKDPWAQPYTEQTVRELAANGVRKLLVFAPAFTADCLETIYEIKEEYRELFEECGGEHLQLVESLNDEPVWIEALSHMIKQRKAPIGETVAALSI